MAPLSDTKTKNTQFCASVVTLVLFFYLFAAAERVDYGPETDISDVRIVSATSPRRVDGVGPTTRDGLPTGLRSVSPRSSESIFVSLLFLLLLSIGGGGGGRVGAAAIPWRCALFCSCLALRRTARMMTRTTR